MITFDYLTLKAFYEENKEYLKGSRIQKIQQPTRRDLILSLRKNGEAKRLYININPQFYHMCFTSKDSEGKRAISIPQKPPMFCMLLRKYIENGIISRVNLPEYERIFELYIETYNELSEKIHICLAIELMGKYSNIILYNDDTNVIIGCAHNIGAEKSRNREIAGTLPYVYPPKQNKTDILTYNGTFPVENIQDKFLGFSSTLVQKTKNKSLEEIKNMFLLKDICPHIAENFENYSIFDDIDGYYVNSVNEVIDKYYSYQIQKENIKTLKRTLLDSINPKIEKAKKTIEKIVQQTNKSKSSYKNRLYGDLIMANLYNNSDYKDKIEVYDYENNQNITINLDKTKTLKENAENFYKLYSKAKATIEKSKDYLASVTMNLDYLEQTKYSINLSQTYEELLELKDEIIPAETKKQTVQKHSFMPEKIEVDGCLVFIGKNNKQNNYIVSKLAKDEDLWFHTKDCAGSHVLLKCPNPDDKLILKCANFAKDFSSASKSSKVGVIYTKAKNLKKPPKSPLGYVIYKGEKEIIL
ncbi:NFACT family protein [bacterium]|nr:NFACT family protein [bacterium]